MPVRLCKLTTKSATIDWDIWYTSGAMMPGVAPVLQFDPDLGAVPGFDSSLIPTSTNILKAKVNVYGSNSATARLHDYLDREQQPVADDDDLDYIRIGIIHEF